MINNILRLVKGKKRLFTDLCKINNLTLSYELNKEGLGIFQDIFQNREYSDYFPFYRHVTVVDIGAHFGFFSIFASNNLDKGSRIIAVEPNKENFSRLRKNISDCKITNINCHNCAIGDKSGISKLYHGQNPNHSIVDNYLLTKEHADFEEVDVKTLEELVSELDLEVIDFLKMDCEGAEYSILYNTPDSVFDKITTISMEFHDLKDNRFTIEGVMEKLLRNGFEIVKLHYDKTSMNLNYGKLIGTKVFSQMI